MQRGRLNCSLPGVPVNLAIFASWGAFGAPELL